MSSDSLSPRLLGTLILATTVLSLAVMAHHPVAHGADLAARLEAIGRIASVARGVHGALIALLALLLALLWEYARSHLDHGPLRRAGGLAWLLGTLLNVLAALVNGFAVPALAASGEAGPGTAEVLRLSWHLNQAFASGGSAALLSGMALWSAAMLANSGPSRWLGAYGVLAGIGTGLALLGGWLRLDVHGMLLVLMLLGVWQLAVAGLLIAGRASAGPGQVAAR